MTKYCKTILPLASNDQNVIQSFFFISRFWEYFKQHTTRLTPLLEKNLLQEPVTVIKL